MALICLWALTTTKPFDTVAYLIFGLVLVIVSISMYFKFISYKSEQNGLTAEDEFSKMIKEKAAANSFNWSIYMWTFAILFLIDSQPRTKIIMGLGIVGMGLIFFLNWLYLSKMGLSDENND
jgi:hypothetical protein